MDVKVRDGGVRLRLGTDTMSLHVAFQRQRSCSPIAQVPFTSWPWHLLKEALVVDLVAASCGRDSFHALFIRDGNDRSF